MTTSKDLGNRAAVKDAIKGRERVELMSASISELNK